MSRLPNPARSTLFVGLLSLALSACASKPAVTCGAGTSEENGTCVPVTTATCKVGQALVGDVCKPVCGAGTIYVGNVCTVADAACGSGTVLQAGQCVISDPLAGASVLEGAEPNDTAQSAVRLELPVLGQPAIVVGGVVGKPVAGVADFDGFIFSAKAGEKVRIALTAVGASSVGAVLEPVGLGGSLRRYVVDPNGRDATREVLLPVAGDWLLRIGDATNLDLFHAAFPRGESGASYLAALSRVAPAPHRSLSVGSVEAGDWNGATVFSIVGDDDARLVNVSVQPAEGASALEGLRSVWMTDVNGKLLGEEVDRPGQSAPEALLARFAVPPAGALLGVDTVVDFSQGNAWTVALDQLSWSEAVTPTQGGGDLSDGGAIIVGFDVDETSVLRVGVSTLGYDLGNLSVELRDPAFRPVKTAFFTTDGAVSGYVAAGAGGRHYVIFRDAAWEEGGSYYGFDWTISQQPVTTISVPAVPGRGTLDDALPDSGEAWYLLESPLSAELTALLTPSEEGSYLALDAFDAEMNPLAPPVPFDTTALVDGLAVAAARPLIFRLTATQSTQVTGSFDLYIPFNANEVEPNDQVDQALELPLEASGAVVVAAKINVEADVDTFKFTLTAPAVVRLLTRKVGTTSLDTILSLADESGATELDVSDDIDFLAQNLYSRLERPLDSGTYVVRVRTPAYQFGDVSLSGPYELSLRSTALPPPVEEPNP